MEKCLFIFETEVNIDAIHKTNENCKSTRNTHVRFVYIMCPNLGQSCTFTSFKQLTWYFYTQKKVLKLIQRIEIFSKKQKLSFFQV